MGTKRKQKLNGFFSLAVPLVVFLLIIPAPLYRILVTALKISTEVFAKPLTYQPANITFDDLMSLFKKLHFEQYFINNFIVSIFVITLVSVMALIGGYAMSRCKFRGKSFVYAPLLYAQMFPAVVLMVPSFQSMNNLRLINDLRSLIIVCSCTNLPYCMFMVMGYYNAIPRTLEETAQVDGCSLPQTVFRVLLSTMRPSVVATGVYAFINSWNVYMYATVLIIGKEKYTVPPAPSIFQGEANTNYGGIVAACVATLIPALFLSSIIQKDLAGGVTSSAMKG